MVVAHGGTLRWVLSILGAIGIVFATLFVLCGMGTRAGGAAGTLMFINVLMLERNIHKPRNWIGDIRPWSLSVGHSSPHNIPISGIKTVYVGLHINI